MNQLTVSGAYGRDYKSVKAVKADWLAGKDFIIRTFGPDNGRYINIADAKGLSIMVRFQRDTKICKVQP